MPIADMSRMGKFFFPFCARSANRYNEAGQLMDGIYRVFGVDAPGRETRQLVELWLFLPRDLQQHVSLPQSATCQEIKSQNLEMLLP